MIDLPEYEHPMGVATPHFRCARLSGALLSVPACAQRWQAAQDGEKCHRCPIGRLHAQPQVPAPSTSTPASAAPAEAAATRLREFGEPRYSSGGPCTRCGRRDLRLIGGCVCVSCANREYEWVKGRNAKGKEPATYAPLFAAEIGIELQNGSVEAWLFKVQHQAEIVARALRIMDHTPGATRVVAAPRPGPAIWNPQTRTFEYQCSRCGAVGLVLERTVLKHTTRDGRMEHHRWCCEGDPLGKGWVFAKVRQPLQAMHVDAVAEWLSSDPELKGETPGVWTPTPYVCDDCGAGQIEALLTQPGGRWHTRCRACGAASTKGAT